MYNAKLDFGLFSNQIFIPFLVLKTWESDLICSASITKLFEGHFSKSLICLLYFYFCIITFPSKCLYISNVSNLSGYWFVLIHLLHIHGFLFSIFSFFGVSEPNQCQINVGSAFGFKQDFIAGHIAIGLYLISYKLVDFCQESKYFYKQRSVNQILFSAKMSNFLIEQS